MIALAALMFSAGAKAGEKAGGYPITGATTGSWFDPANSGHGFLLQVISSTQVGVAWFNYHHGEQIWLTGVGAISDNRAVIPLSILSGGEFPPNFRQQQVQWTSWGTATFEFTGPDSGAVHYQSILPEFGSGTLRLARLTRIAGPGSFPRNAAKALQDNTIPVGKPQAAPPSGFGTQALPRHDDLTPETKALIEDGLERNQLQLIARGKSALAKSAEAVAFSWPARAADGVADAGFHAINGFVDEDVFAPGSTRDYQCGARTYDTAGGYNHSGVDIFPWPFAWARMDNRQIEVVAAAPGVIIDKWDGNFDRNTAPNDGQPNAVFLRHDDGSQSWYVHLKKNSLTAKTVGERVERGEFLGIIGSSGNSTGVHLHFEVHDPAGQVIDPFAGPCNSLGGDSRWHDQPAYFDSKLNRLATALAPPDQNCLDNMQCNEADRFQGGQSVYFVSYFRDLVAGQVVQHRILKPDGSVFVAWQNRFSAAAHWPSGYFWQRYALPAQAPAGTWTYEVTYQGRTYLRGFKVGSDQFSIQPEISGSWYDPEQPGQGLLLEAITVNGQPTLNIVWFTFEHGKQRWLFGNAGVQGNRAVVPMSVTSGAEFPPVFKSGDVSSQKWGHVELTFLDCNSALFSWSANEPAIGSGSLRLARLSGVEGMACH